MKLLQVFCLLGLSLVHGDFPPKEYVMNVDDPASVRLQQVCEDKKAYIIEFYETFIAYFPDEVVTLATEVGEHYFQVAAFEPYKSEIQYISECSGIDYGDLMVINILYDLTAFCTSIVASDASGTILHGRNLDYNFPILRNCTYVMHFVDSDGNHLYSGTSFFGYVGLWTGRNPNKFSISADERDQGEIRANIQAIRDDWIPVSWLIRDVLANATDYNDALNQLTKTQIQAPVYFILGGLQYPQGAVITRNQTEAIDVWLLEDSEYVWYLVETNYDHWLPPPDNDDRRDPAIKAMNAVGQANITYDSLYGVLSTHPVLNNHTLYTTIMSASDPDYYYNKVRTPKDPSDEEL